MGMKNLAFVLAMVSPMASPVFAAQLMPLAAHRAVYDLKLLQGTSNKAPSDARGRIAFDFTGSACDGYVMNFRQITEMTPAEGAVRVSDMKSATFEDGEGKAFRFTVQTKLDGGADDDLDGQALRASNGDLSIELKRPKLKKADMGQNVIFPTDHIKRILATARDGGTTLGVKVFDGSDGGEKIFDTLSVIGKPLTSEPQEAAAHKPELVGMTRWPVAISYFTVGKSDDAPDYVLSFDLYENGISRALKLDYGDFVMSGEMSQLEILPAAVCGK